MNSIDLSRFGIDQKIDLDGEVVESSVVVGGTLLFFFEENHARDASVQSCLRMACRIIDAGILNTVCIEGYSCGAYQNKEFQNLGKRALMQQIADDTLIAKPLRNTKNYILFEDTLCVLRPAVNIVGIEDIEAYKNAESVLNSQRERILDGAFEAAKEVVDGLSSLKNIDDPAMRQKSFKRPLVKRIKKMNEDMEKSVVILRDQAFIRNIVQIVKPNETGHAAIVNVGRAHHDRVIGGLRANGGYSILRIRPQGLEEYDKKLRNAPVL